MSLATRSDTDVLPPTFRHVVVVLDDDLRTLSALQRLFRHEPYEARTTFAPAEAMKWIASGDVSLLLSDHHMPDMSGVDLFESARRLSPDITCVLLTGYPERLRSRPGWRSSVRELVEKPWDDVALRKTVRLLLREREMRDNRTQG